MTKSPVTLATIDPDGGDIYQEIPEELMPELAAAFAEAERLGPNIADDDCPICRVMKASGLEMPTHGGPQTRMSARGGRELNWGERRTEASRVRRRLKRRKVRAS